jgi:hypothetical protein
MGFLYTANGTFSSYSTPWEEDSRVAERHAWSRLPFRGFESGEVPLLEPRPVYEIGHPYITKKFVVAVVVIVNMSWNTCESVISSIIT